MARHSGCCGPLRLAYPGLVKIPVAMEPCLAPLGSAVNVKASTSRNSPRPLIQANVFNGSTEYMCINHGTAMRNTFIY
jgi:hypothetical protein